MPKLKVPHFSDIDPKTKKTLSGSIILIAVLAIVLMTVFHSTDGFTAIVETEPATMVTERDYMTFTAYTLKNEKIVTSKYSGGVYYVADDAARVNPGDSLANVYKNSVDENTVKAGMDIDRCIAILEESIGDGLFTLEESKIGDHISKTYNDMMRAVANGDVSVISAGADEFLVMLNKMRSYSGNSEAMKTTLEEYKVKRSKLREAYTGDFEAVNAKESGFFFRSTDGYENIYTSENISELTYEAFFEMTDKAPDEGGIVGKLLVDYLWYLAIPTVSGVSDTYSVGGFYDVSFPDCGNETFNMKLDRILYDSTGSKSVMLFSCGIVSGDFDYLRVQQVNITHRNVSGYRVPSSAICKIGGNTGVYILKDGMASFRKVVILYEGDGYYIVSSGHSNSDGYYVYL